MTTNFEADRPAADLGELKIALRGLSLPPAEETAMRSAFRARQRALEAASAARATERSRRPELFAVAAGIVAMITAAIIVANGDRQAGEAPVPPQATAVVGVAPDMGVTAFQPLMFSPGFTPSSSYNVVRVRIPLSALALVPGQTADGMIEADLLIGEDGLARGIRFNPADAMLAAAASQQ